MDSTALNSVEKLSDHDKAELQQFLQNESQKAKVQASVHTLTEVCFRKCVTSTIKNGKLDKNEEGCLTNCTERFFDLNNLIVQHLRDMRES
ncbi:Tim10/DDP family zinc finger protein [Nemania abortiva]|nr:Tim10/DDP family zinc finger protein [Nemania abortiva]